MRDYFKMFKRVDLVFLLLEIYSLKIQNVGGKYYKKKISVILFLIVKKLFKYLKGND